MLRLFARRRVLASRSTALVFGCVLGSALSYSLLSPSPPRVQFNSAYGSPRDFQRAIQDLHRVLRVSTDEDDLHVHGFSDNDHHIGACRLSPPHSRLTLSRLSPHRRRLPYLHGGRRPHRAHRKKVPHARRPLLGRNQSRRPLESGQPVSLFSLSVLTLR